MNFKQHKIKSTRDTNIDNITSITTSLLVVVVSVILFTLLIIRYWSTDYVPTLPQQAITDNEIEENISDWEIVNCYYTENNDARCRVTPPHKF